MRLDNHEVAQPAFRGGAFVGDEDICGVSASSVCIGRCCSRNDHLHQVAMRHVMCDWYSKRTKGAVLTLGERKGLLRRVLKRSCVCPRDESRSGSVRSETNSGSRVPWAVAYRAPLASRAGRCGSCRETRRSCLVTTRPDVTRSSGVTSRFKV